MSDFTITRLHVPQTLDDPSAGPFLGMVAVRNAVMEEAIGSPDNSALPAELLPHWRDIEFDPVIGFVAEVDGRVVGRAYCIFSLNPDAPDVEVAVDVIDGFRRRGIGSALLESVIRLARDDHRSILQGDFFAPSFEGAEMLSSPTGFGAVPRGTAGVEFALAKGFSLEQVERYSALPLPIEPEILAGRLAAIPDDNDYRVLSWAGVTPEEHLADIAMLHSRMSTDAPSGGLEISEAIWDVERVRIMEAGQASAGQTQLMTVAEHVPSGHLVGLNVLLVPAAVHRAVSQNDTLVLREHRGHRLGMLLKLTNLDLLQRDFPGHPRIVTFNAEENRPMLDVNEAIGFEPVAYAGAWKLVLPEARPQ